MMIIDKLTLFTAHLEAQISFYSNTLDFEIIEQSATSVSFKTGNSILEFKKKENAKPYHFAFNIPNNKIDEALVWLKKRVPLISSEDVEIITFEKWNANALYFYDKDLNTVEFIARNTLNITSDQKFSSEEIISISEIGMPVENIESIYYQINDIKKIEIYDGNLKRFCAIGNEEGLFVIINKEIKKWFPPMDTAYSEDFIIQGDYNFEYIDGKIKKLP